MHYLDHNATSTLRPEARAAMDRALAISANASSIHARGRAARGLIENAREITAAFLGAAAEDLVFTSGGTEANFLALGGAVLGAAEAEARITRVFVSAIEHPSVLENAKRLAERTAGLRL
ncbi:MAG: aminotransferase class V-fold PLP-dependent enzyme, partial [Alphaproteobacteria bacterium]|nr:aminotransferase class V-fold PLP-dependent enzyme [Alphaproteobacteria bacterium]